MRKLLLAAVSMMPLVAHAQPAPPIPSNVGFAYAATNADKNPGFKVNDPAVIHDGNIRVPIEVNGGVYTVNVAFDTDHKPLQCIVDSGAFDISIPDNIAAAMLKLGLVTPEGETTYVDASGNKAHSYKFLIRDVGVAGVTQHNVEGSTVPDGGTCLLGQSFLRRFNAFAVNYQHNWLILFPWNN